MELILQIPTSGGERAHRFAPVVDDGLDHELIGLGLGIPKGVPHRRGVDRIPVDFDLRSEDGDDHSTELDRDETGSLQQLGEARQREEPKMALVEQAPRPVVEAALEEGEPHVDVRNVGNRGDDVAARRQERRYRSQYLQRVTQVLKHVTQQDDVEGQARQLRHVVVDVEIDDKYVTSMGLGALRRLRVDLQPGHLASTRTRALW